MMITVIGRGHSGTRAMSHTLSASGVYMGAELNVSGDLVPPEDMYEACRVMARHVSYLGHNRWDFSKLHTMPIDPAFTRLIESYLASVLSTTLVFPWIVRLFPDIHYIYWIRDPRDCILGGHVTDDLSRFGVSYDQTDDLRLRRAVSWKYQVELIKSTPKPTHWQTVRFEDFVLKQEQSLERLKKYLGFELATIPVDPTRIGQWKADTSTHNFDFFQADLIEHGYL
jgi:hypothetical protein